MSIKRAGITTPTRLAPRVTWTPQTGNVLIETWEMSSEHYDAFVLGIQQAGLLSFSKVEDGGKVRVELSYGVAGADATGQQSVADPLARVWTRHWNVDQISLWALPEVQRELNKFTNPRDRKLFRSDVEAYLDGQTEVPDPDKPGQMIPLTIDNINAVVAKYGLDQQVVANLMDALSSGVETKIVVTPVLRKTLTVTQLSALRASSENVGRVFSSASLAASEPTLNQAALIDAAGLTNFVWLKMGPEVTDLTRGQFEIVQEWWGFAEHLKFVYGELL